MAAQIKIIFLKSDEAISFKVSEVTNIYVYF